MSETKSVQIKLWGQIVGYIALTENRLPVFEYEDSFKRSKLEISPLEMPLTTTFRYTQAKTNHTFSRLPGIIADCLPDRFGMRIICDFYKSKYGLEEHKIDPIKKLLYIGKRAIGALEFFPSEDLERSKIKDDLLEIEKLRIQAIKTLSGKANIITAEIMRVGGSAGGAQAKALIDFNPQNNNIKSGFTNTNKGYIPCIIKFDGVRDGEEEGCYGRLEYVYSLMAKACGIDMPKTYILEEDGRAHFVVERFDRNSDKTRPFHYASLCGLTCRDYIQKHSCSYEDYLSVVTNLTNDLSQTLNAFKLAAFNIVFRNQDDHTKNFGFLMDQSGKWKISPAFDLNYVFDSGSANTHQMKLNGKDDEFNMEDFLKTGRAYGLKKAQIEDVIFKTIEVSNHFLDLATQNKLEESFAAAIARKFRTQF